MALLIFDGDCGFCTLCARWIEARWPPEVARAVPWQALDDERMAALGWSEADVMARAWWVEGTNLCGGERAVAAALTAVGGTWGRMGRCLGAAPLRYAARPVYRLIARYRHHLPGATAACQRRGAVGASTVAAHDRPRVASPHRNALIDHGSMRPRSYL